MVFIHVYLTIVFAIGYMLYYHVLSSNRSMYDEYKEEMQVAQMQRENWKIAEHLLMPKMQSC